MYQFMRYFLKKTTERYTVTFFVNNCNIIKHAFIKSLLRIQIMSTKVVGGKPNDGRPNDKTGC